MKEKNIILAIECLILITILYAIKNDQRFEQLQLELKVTQMSYF